MRGYKRMAALLLLLVVCLAGLTEVAEAAKKKKVRSPSASRVPLSSPLPPLPPSLFLAHFVPPSPVPLLRSSCPPWSPLLARVFPHPPPAPHATSRSCRRASTEIEIKSSQGGRRGPHSLRRVHGRCRYACAPVFSPSLSSPPPTSTAIYTYIKG